jgi:hypothetical protein
MEPYDLRGMISDPEFRSWPVEKRLRVLEKAGADPDFVSEYKALKMSGGEGARPEPSPEASVPEEPEMTPIGKALHVLGIPGRAIDKGLGKVSRAVGSPMDAPFSEQFTAAMVPKGPTEVTALDAAVGLPGLIGSMGKISPKAQAYAEAVARPVARTASSMAVDPVAWGALGGLGKLGRIGKAAHLGVGGAFVGQMGKGAVESYKDYAGKMVREGATPDTLEPLIESAISAGMAVTGAKGTLHSFKGLSARPTPEEISAHEAAVEAKAKAKDAALEAKKAKAVAVAHSAEAKARDAAEKVDALTTEEPSGLMGTAKGIAREIGPRVIGHGIATALGVDPMTQAALEAAYTGGREAMRARANRKASAQPPVATEEGRIVLPTEPQQSIELPEGLKTPGIVERAVAEDQAAKGDARVAFDRASRMARAGMSVEDMLKRGIPREMAEAIVTKVAPPVAAPEPIAVAPEAEAPLASLIKPTLAEKAPSLTSILKTLEQHSEKGFAKNLEPEESLAITEALGRQPERAPTGRMALPVTDTRVKMPRRSAIEGSTAFKGWAYSPKNQIVEIEHKNGAVYRHYGVPESVYNALRSDLSLPGASAGTILGAFERDSRFPKTRQASGTEVETAVLPQKGKVVIPTNLGGKAKPGPEATPVSELESALQTTADAVAAAKLAGRPPHEALGAISRKGAPVESQEPVSTPPGAPYAIVGGQRVEVGDTAVDASGRTVIVEAIGESGIPTLRPVERAATPSPKGQAEEPAVEPRNVKYSVEPNAKDLTDAGARGYATRAEAERVARAWPGASVEKRGLFFFVSGEGEGVGPGRDLTAFHNLTADDLLKADKLGGLASPSIAITRGKVHEGYGDITLVGHRAMVDPGETSLNRIFPNDAYTSRFPDTTWKLKRGAKDKFLERFPRKEFYELGDEGFDKLDKGPDVALDYARRSLSLRAAFLREKGIKVSPLSRETHIRFDIARDPELIEWAKKNPDASDLRPQDPGWVDFSRAVSDAVDRIPLEPEYLKNADLEDYGRRIQRRNLFDVDGDGKLLFGPADRLLRDIHNASNRTTEFDRSGTGGAIDSAIEKHSGEYEEWIRRQIAPLYEGEYLKLGRKKVPVTLENVVEIMRRNAKPGAEDTMTFGPGSARAAASKPFRNISAARSAKSRLVSDKDFKEWKDANGKLQDDMQSSLWDSYRVLVTESNFGSRPTSKWIKPEGFGSVWDANNSMYRAVSRYLRSTTDSFDRMESALRSEGFRDAPRSAIQKAVDVAQSIRDAPTEYFEAKPLRGVGLGEFVGAVIPEEASPAVRAALEKNGVPFETYSSGNAEARQAAADRILASGGGGRDVRFSSASPEGKPTPITLESVRSNLPKALSAKVVERKGDFVISTPRGEIVIKPTGDVQVDWHALEVGYGKEGVSAVKAGAKRIVGSTEYIGRDAIVNLVDTGALPHEGAHVYLDHFSTPKERSVIERDLRAVVEREGKGGRNVDEVFADGFSDWFKNDRANKPTTMIGSLYARIYDFFNGIYRTFNPNVESVYRDVGKGKVFNRGAGKVAPALKTAPAFAAAPKDIGDRSANFKKWFGDSKVVDEKGDPVVAYHGTHRADRVGNRFRASRATSGPMQFFTQDPAIASNYAKGKPDTSLEAPSDYAEWFKVKPKGSRSEVDIDRAWYHLSPEERSKIADRLPHVVRAEENDYSKGYRLGGTEEYGLAGKGHWDYEIKAQRGNVLKAAKETWLNGGDLIESESAFMDILRLGGMDMSKVRFDDPHMSREGVFPVYLSIKRPLDVSALTQEQTQTLQRAANRARTKAQQYGADAWDKNTRHPQSWMEMLRENPETAWTSIPDWVTRELKRMGYDGIKDTGGKMGGEKHVVWIPFEETQIKSATGNVGTFSPDVADIRYAIVPGEKSRSKGASEDLVDEVKARGNSLVFRLIRNPEEAKAILEAVEKGTPAEGFRPASVVDGHALSTKGPKIARALNKGATPIFTSPYPTVAARYKEGANLFVAIEHDPSGLVYESSRVKSTQGRAHSATFEDSEHVIDARSVKAVYVLTPEQVANIEASGEALKGLVRRGMYKNAFRDKDSALAEANIESSLRFKPPVLSLGRPFVEAPVTLENGLQIQKGSKVRLQNGVVATISGYRVSPPEQVEPPPGGAYIEVNTGGKHYLSPHRAKVAEYFAGKAEAAGDTETATRIRETQAKYEQWGDESNVPIADVVAVWDKQSKKWVEPKGVLSEEASTTPRLAPKKKAPLEDWVR